MDAQRLQRRPLAGAYHANAVLHLKPRTMGGANEQLARLVEAAGIRAGDVVLEIFNQ